MLYWYMYIHVYLTGRNNQFLKKENETKKSKLLKRRNFF